MKTIALLICLSCSCLFAGEKADSSYVKKSVILKSISIQQQQAEEAFNATLTAKQIRLKERIAILEGQSQAIYAVDQDSIKVQK